MGCKIHKCHLKITCFPQTYYKYGVLPPYYEGMGVGILFLVQNSLVTNLQRIVMPAMNMDNYYCLGNALAL